MKIGITIKTEAVFVLPIVIAVEGDYEHELDY